MTSPASSSRASSTTPQGRASPSRGSGTRRTRPAPWSTIGGNVATNAGGLCCLKYGVTRDYVLGHARRRRRTGRLTYGSAVALGRKTNKGVAGLDLAGLMVGSEGILGVVSEITLRLRPALVGTPRTIVGSFASLVEAGEAVALVTERGLIPSALELLDRESLGRGGVEADGLEADAAALLLARVDTPGEGGELRLRPSWRRFRTLALSGRLVRPTTLRPKRSSRRAAWCIPAFERLGPVLTEDICVPRSKVPHMLAELGAIAERNGVRIATIAHAGDGNLHPLLLSNPGDDAARLASEIAFEQLLDAAIAIGGTVSGEHGVGLLKMGGMERELDPGSLRCNMRSRMRSTR